MRPLSRRDAAPTDDPKPIASDWIRQTTYFFDTYPHLIQRFGNLPQAAAATVSINSAKMLSPERAPFWSRSRASGASIRVPFLERVQPVELGFLFFGGGSGQVDAGNHRFEHLGAVGMGIAEGVDPYDGQLSRCA
jgi:hypothetical protein